MLSIVLPFIRVYAKHSLQDMYKNLQFMIIRQSRRTPALYIHYLSQHNILCYHFNIIHLLFPGVNDVCVLIADYSPAYCFKSIIFTTFTALSIIDKKASIVLSSHPANHINIRISSCDKSMPRRNFSIFSICRF